MLESLSVGDNIVAKVFDLVEQNSKKTQPVQQLAGQAGLPAAPTTATGTGALGGTPQQQAMAGTPAQKRSVFESVTKVAAPQGETQLEQARTLRGPATATAETEAKKAFTAKIVGAMGTFGAKASEFVDSAMKSVTGTATSATATTGTGTQLATEVDIKDQIVSSVPADKQEAVKTILKKLADPATPKEDLPGLEVSLNTLLGKDVNSMLTPEQKRELYTPTADVLTTTGGAAVAGAIAGADQKLTISDLTTLGTTPAELASILGISEADVGNLTIGQLQERLTAKGQAEFAPVQATTAGMASGLLSSTERAALRDTLRTLEETGLAGAATQYASLLNDIDKGTTVRIGDQEFTVEELASSQQMTDIISQYLKGGDFAKDLAAAEPEFATWIESNRTALDAAVGLSVASTTGLKQIQTDVAKKFQNIPATTLKILGAGPDKDGFYTRAPTVAEGSTLDYVVKLPEAQRGVASANLEALSAAGEDISKYTPEQIAARELSDVNGRGARYAAAVKEQKRAASLTNPEEQLDNAVAGDFSIADVNSLLGDATLASAMGFDAGNVVELDTNSDGVFDATDTQALNVKASTPPSFDDWNAGKGFKPAQVKVSNLSVDQSAVLAAAKDGTITADEVKDIPIDSLSQIVAKMPDSKYARSLDAILDQRSNEELASANVPMAEVTQVIQKPLPPITGVWERNVATFNASVAEVNNLIAKLKSTLNTNMSSRSKTKVQAAISQLETQLRTLRAHYKNVFKPVGEKLSAQAASRPPVKPFEETPTPSPFSETKSTSPFGEMPSVRERNR